MAGNWTPGPWVIAGRYPVVTEQATEIEIARCFSGSNRVQNGAKARANASLIAASPDGFAAAESAYRLLLRVPHDLPLRFLNQSVYAALLDYIAKALGEEAETVQNRYEAEARGDQPDSDPPIPNSATPQGA